MRFWLLLPPRAMARVYLTELPDSPLLLKNVQSTIKPPFRATAHRAGGERSLGVRATKTSASHGCFTSTTPRVAAKCRTVSEVSGNTAWGPMSVNACVPHLAG
eukprot:13898638-Alexandrium_andersonii.AAC.1